MRINVADEAMKSFAISELEKESVDLSKVEFFFHPTNDAWCRDHGPAFLVNPAAEIKKVIVDWGSMRSGMRTTLLLEFRKLLSSFSILRNPYE